MFCCAVRCPIRPLPRFADGGVAIDVCLFFRYFIFGNIVPLHKSYSDVGNMGSIFSATLQPILHVPGNIIIFGTEILECTQIVGKIRNRNIIIFSAKKKFFLTMSQSEK